MKIARLKRRISIALAMLMLTTTIPAAVFGASALTELRTKQLDLNHQITLYSGTYYNSANSAKAAENYMVYAPGSEITPLVAYGNDIYGCLLYTSPSPR